MEFHGFGFMGIWGFLFWIVMFVVMFYLLRLLLSPFLPQGRTRRDEREEALAILKKRFARGEIDEEEFIRRKRALEEE